MTDFFNWRFVTQIPCLTLQAMRPNFGGTAQGQPPDMSECEHKAKEFCILQVRIMQLDDCAQIEWHTVDGYDCYQAAALSCSQLISTTGRNNRVRLFDGCCIAEFIVMYAHTFDTENQGRVQICCGLIKSTVQQSDTGDIVSMRDVYMTYQGELIVHLTVRDAAGGDRELVYFHDKDSFDRIISC